MPSQATDLGDSAPTKIFGKDFDYAALTKDFGKDIGKDYGGFSLGDPVEVHGLSAQPHFNGRLGRVATDVQKGQDGIRFGVQL